MYQNFGKIYYFGASSYHLFNFFMNALTFKLNNVDCEEKVNSNSKNHRYSHIERWKISELVGSNCGGMQ